MKSILACTDGSIYATSVYDHSAWAAKRSAAKVHVLHMLDPKREQADIVDRSGNLGLDTSQELLSELVAFEETKNRLAREHGKTILHNAKQHLQDAGVEQVSTEQLHGGLIEAVTRLEHQVDLVVLGKRGNAADFAKLHLGSNLERVIRASSRPVLVASRQFKPIKRLLIAYDGGQSADKAIRFAIDNPLLKDLECHLIRAGRIDSNAESSVQQAADTLRSAGYIVHPKAIQGDAETVISNIVEKEDIHLLVMGAYGHSRIRQLMVGSTTTAMVRTCRIPVLMFR